MRTLLPSTRPTPDEEPAAEPSEHGNEQVLPDSISASRLATAPGFDQRLHAYIDGQLPDGTSLPLFRLRYGGSANSWGFAIHLASRDAYQDAVLPSGYPVGTPEEALDCACGLYLNDPSAWQPPTN